MTSDPLQRLRDLCLALPETSERLSHGEPAWFIQRKRMFVMYFDHHHNDRVSFHCATAPGVQDELVSADPQRFFVPPYDGYRGWIGVRVDVPVDWELIATLVTDAYRTVAPRKLVAQLEASSIRA
jgi:hypothetical protein